MIGRKALFIVSISLTTAMFVSAQRAPRAEDLREKFARLDADANGTIERDEINADASAIFKAFDRNNDGAIDEIELPKPSPEGRRNSPPRGSQPDIAPLPPPPPFMMRDENRDGKVTRVEFDENVRQHFAVMDANGDGAISREEFEQMHRREREDAPPIRDNAPPPAATVQFLGAEMRFGDKLIKDAPFSAETVMENTRRLYDGSTVTTQSKGAIYRDGAGRTRREQPLETVGAFRLGDDAQRLIFITDANENTQYFLDAPRKIARRIPLSNGNRLPAKSSETDGRKIESLGKKTIEGVTVEGTRTTIEIPANSVGNEKPLGIVTERWFSEELQTVVLLRHVDPLLGEQIFRLTNLRRTEPAKEFFVVPNDYKIENDRQPR